MIQVQRIVQCKHDTRAYKNWVLHFFEISITINQSINQAIYQSINQSIKQASKQVSKQSLWYVIIIVYNCSILFRYSRTASNTRIRLRFLDEKTLCTIFLGACSIQTLWPWGCHRRTTPCRQRWRKWHWILKTYRNSCSSCDRLQGLLGSHK